MERSKTAWCRMERSQWEPARLALWEIPMESATAHMEASGDARLLCVDPQTGCPGASGRKTRRIRSHHMVELRRCCRLPLDT